MGVVQREQGERARFPWFKSPNMDRLAAEGVRFRNAFVTLSLCAPSRAAFLTGRYNHLNGITNNGTPFPTNAVTHATLLRAAGYRTAYIGKWHMGNQRGQRPGFDYSASFIGHGRYQDCPFEINGVSTPTTGLARRRQHRLRHRVDEAEPRPSVFDGCRLQEPAQPAWRQESPRAPAQPLRRRNQPPHAQLRRARHLPQAGPEDRQERRPASPTTPFTSTTSATSPAWTRTSADCSLPSTNSASPKTRWSFTPATTATISANIARATNGRSTRNRCASRCSCAIRACSAKAASWMKWCSTSTSPRPSSTSRACRCRRKCRARAGRNSPPAASPRTGASRSSPSTTKNWATCPPCYAVRTTTHKLVKYPNHPEWTEVFDLAADPYEIKNLASDAALTAKLEAELDSLMKAVNYTVPPNANKPPPAAKEDK